VSKRLSMPRLSAEVRSDLTVAGSRFGPPSTDYARVLSRIDDAGQPAHAAFIRRRRGFADSADALRSVEPLWQLRMTGADWRVAPSPNTRTSRSKRLCNSPRTKTSMCVAPSLRTPTPRSMLFGNSRRTKNPMCVEMSLGTQRPGPHTGSTGGNGKRQALHPTCRYCVSGG
jgi:hypothetical protein